MKFSEVKGDLFSCDAACSLAHCISEDCRMGKGIAVAFRDKFGSVDELKRQVNGGFRPSPIKRDILILGHVPTKPLKEDTVLVVSSHAFRRRCCWRCPLVAPRRQLGVDSFSSLRTNAEPPNGAKTGHVAILKKDSRFIYYLITKAKYFQKPTYESVRSSLEAVKRHCSANGVSQLAMPRIGCGLDGLDWKTVEPMIKDVFADTDIDITIYYR